MEKSPLQIARAAYQPKMPASIANAAKLVEGKATESVADQAEPGGSRTSSWLGKPLRSALASALPHVIRHRKGIPSETQR